MCEVVTPELLKIHVFWNVTLCRTANFLKTFRRIWCLHIQGHTFYQSTTPNIPEDVFSSYARGSSRGRET